MTGKRTALTVGDLLDFNPHEYKREQCIVTWKCLALEVGVGEDTLQRWFAARKIELPRWGPHDNSPVFLPKGRVMVLRVLYFG